MAQAVLMDGTALAREIVSSAAKRAAAFTRDTGTSPCLAAVLVGEDPGSVTYVRMKQNRCERAGISSRRLELPASTTTAELVETIGGLSADPVNGILPDMVRTADIVVAAVGRPEFVRGDRLQPGAVVVDAGYNPGNVGDVAFSEALGKASLTTPVPGGVGPMTIAVLLDQTMDAAVSQAAASMPGHGAS
jgi:5,10-methylene-tetrahydrofolate dehydrogenase/methenyl tetrahydrofolate cyclohydrolase